MPMNSSTLRLAPPTSAPSMFGFAQKLQPLAHLEYDHPAIVALGLDPNVAESLGIGYAPKGVARGNVVIPVREADGTLRGYLGVQELTFIPKDFETPDNVVPLKSKKA